MGHMRGRQRREGERRKKRVEIIVRKQEVKWRKRRGKKIEN